MELMFATSSHADTLRKTHSVKRSKRPVLQIRHIQPKLDFVLVPESCTLIHLLPGVKEIISKYTISE